MPEFVTDQLASLLTGQFIVSALTILIVVHVILITVAYLIYLERKLSAYIQDRLGPNRVGFDFGLPFLSFLKGCLGLGQPLADGLKFLLKEDYSPTKVDKALFTLAPIVIIVPALMGFVIIPWGGMWDMPAFTIPLLGIDVAGGPVHVTGAAINVGIIYLLAIGSLGVYGVTLGGWASNSKFSFIGGLRATAQMISYEIPLALSLLAALLLIGSVMPESIVRYQVDNGWLIFSQPIAALIFFMAIMAEANRAPFDNAEAEQELVGGYHTEYSSMRFALFFLAEYAHMVTSSAFFALIFLGGYQLLPFVNDPLTSPDAMTIWAVLAKFAVFMGKVVLLISLMMVARWTLPRLRYDQVMTMAWQGVIPLSLAVVVVTSVMVFLGYTGLLPMLAVNLVMILAAIWVQALLPVTKTNDRVPMYGSRFNPVVGEFVSTSPTDPMALEDRPVQGTAPKAV
jgi:NADH-quinone oxidoreductase subunit H